MAIAFGLKDMSYAVSNMVAHCVEVSTGLPLGICSAVGYRVNGVEGEEKGFSLSPNLSKHRDLSVLQEKDSAD